MKWIRFYRYCGFAMIGGFFITSTFTGDVGQVQSAFAALGVAIVYSTDAARGGDA